MPQIPENTIVLDEGLVVSKVARIMHPCKSFFTCDFQGMHCMHACSGIPEMKMHQNKINKHVDDQVILHNANCVNSYFIPEKN